MLQLKNIKKRYEAGEFSVDALKGITLSFRTSEFVSILGPSGCGKTTMLNIIGGLDKYTSGDLIINGKSTEKFTDRDWDAYRNHSVGFVFQSYNLIPHQTALQNVELALALSGVKRAERVRRAKEALDSVGLKNMYNKRPNEMSGGQMQRVAIARAIVNNPDIVLADEPTGALDTETSLQVMEILKEISRDRLVVMVTHNPDLAERYSTRVVNMLDGLLVSDSKPLTQEEIQQETKADEVRMQQEKVAEKTLRRREKKPSMSLGTSFMLSLKNLFSKRGRTILTSLAGSIGIIGIALIFAVSQGATNYIASVQEDTLASYPLTIQETHTDMGSLFQSFVGSATSQEEHDLDAVYEKMALYNLAESFSNIQQTENDLAAYKKYLDNQLKDPNSVVSQSLNGVHYGYNLDLLVYTKNIDGEVIRADTSELVMEVVSSFYGVDISQMITSGSGLFSSLLQTGGTLTMWEEMLPATDGGVVNEMLKSQYDLVFGNWPDSYSDPTNKIVLVVDDNNEIDDMTLYALGLKSTEEINAILDAAQKGEEPPASTQKHWTYEEICNLQYKTIFNYERYQKMGNLWYDATEIDNVLNSMYEDDSVGMKLEVVGIIRPNPDVASHMLSGNICYTSALTQYVIEKAQDSQIVQEQKANPNVDVFTGLYFQNNNLPVEQKAQFFTDYVSGLDVSGKADVYLTINTVPTDAEVEQAATQLYGMEEEQLRSTILNLYKMAGSVSGTQSPQVEDYLSKLSFEELQKLIPTIAPGYATYTKTIQIIMTLPTEQQRADKLDEDIASYTVEQKANCFDTAMPFSSTTYDDNLAELGDLDLASPSSISLYAVSFAAKDDIEKDIARYNEGVSEEQKLEYTDYVGLLMRSVTTIIDAITYILVAFVSISLIVSSIMIGVITLISVQERTKEIGILRAIGASKRNVSSMFNAETVIIGFASGLLGVVVTYLLCLLVNVILHSLTGILTLNAVLPIWVAMVLVLISMLLTLVAGLIPSRSAAKKDPVVALRTE